MTDSELVKLAKKLAREANDCCRRSDGYEEDMRDLILDAFKTVRTQERERCVKMVLETFPPGYELSTDGAMKVIAKTLRDSKP